MSLLSVVATFWVFQLAVTGSWPFGHWSLNQVTPFRDRTPSCVLVCRHTANSYRTTDLV